MGLAIPRPAMRAREERIIRAKIKWGIERENSLIAQGIDTRAARDQAFNEALRLKFRRDGSLIEPAS